MMNEHGKSGRLEVPKKSPNNTGQPVAEGREGRSLAKGNLRPQNASRTPGRSDAPSALERVRQAARGDKELRFTVLLHHIDNLETLRRAYFSLRRNTCGWRRERHREAVPRRSWRTSVSTTFLICGSTRGVGSELAVT